MKITTEIAVGIATILLTLGGATWYLATQITFARIGTDTADRLIAAQGDQVSDLEERLLQLEATIQDLTEIALRAESASLTTNSSLEFTVSRVSALEQALATAQGVSDQDALQIPSIETRLDEIEGRISSLDALTTPLVGIGADTSLVTVNELPDISQFVRNGDRITLQGEALFLRDLDSRGRDELDVVMSGAGTAWLVERTN